MSGEIAKEQAETVQESEFSSLLRRLSGRQSRILDAIVIAWALFVVVCSLGGFLPAMVYRAIFLGFGLVVGYALYRSHHRADAGRIKWTDIALMAAGLISIGYVIGNYQRIVLTAYFMNPLDIALGLVLTALVLELGRRVVGFSFTAISLVLILYALLGPYMPGPFAHRGLTLSTIVDAIYMGSSGLWGLIPGLASSTVAIFVLFGAILFNTGAGETFIDIALALTGRSPGGAGKVSVISSALFGMINGSASANASVDGPITIPAMIRLGYRREFAAAVEAVSSTGGQIMPPIMGAGAFIMAELAGVPYVKIATMAIIPAILYYVTIYISIHLEALSKGYQGVPVATLPSLGKALHWRKSVPLIVPLVALLYPMVIGFSPPMAGVIGIGTIVVVHLLLGGPAEMWLKRGMQLVEGLRTGGYGMLTLAVLASGAQIVVVLIGSTGLGLTLTEFLIKLSSGNLAFALVITALIALILGMGVTTVADYVITAAVAVPILVTLGLAPIYAHLFIFYWSASSGLTPPVGAVAFVTAGIAEANYFKTCLVCCRLALSAFVVPFILVYRPALALQGSVGEISYATGMALVGLVAASAAFAGYLLRKTAGWQRLLLFLAAGLLLYPAIWADVAGIVCLLAVVGYQWMTRSAVAVTISSST